MAKSKVTFRCGCGFSCSNPLEAGLHADSTKHTLTAQGTIIPDNKPVKKDD